MCMVLSSPGVIVKPVHTRAHTYTHTYTHTLHTDILRVIPDSRVLVETDRQAPVGKGTEVAAEELLRVCRAIAEAKGVSIEGAVALANRNATRFLARACPHAES